MSVFYNGKEALIFLLVLACTIIVSIILAYITLLGHFLHYAKRMIREVMAEHEATKQAMPDAVEMIDESTKSKI